MKSIDPDYLKGQDDAASKGSPTQLAALEVWFDLRYGTRYTMMMKGLPPAPSCFRLQLVPVVPNPTMEPIPHHLYLQIRAKRMAEGHARFLRSAGRDPKSPEWDAVFCRFLIEQGQHCLCDPHGLPLFPLKMPSDLTSRFGVTP